MTVPSRSVQKAKSPPTLTVVGHEVKPGPHVEPAVSENLGTLLVGLQDAIDEFDRAWSRSANPFGLWR